jgi:hypothetical protein
VRLKRQSQRASGDLYAVLGVSADAPDEAIRFAYRRRASGLMDRRWRPGKAARDLAELNAAYEILGTPDRRADYDRRRSTSQPGDSPLNGVHHARPASGSAGVRGGGLLEIVAIVAVIIFAGYVGYTLVNTRSLVDLSFVLDAGESVGLPVRKRTAPAPKPAADTPPRPIATALPTSAPPAPPPTLAPAEPKPAGDAYEGTSVSVDNPNPARRSPIGIGIKIMRDGKPVDGSEIYAVAHFRTLDERWPASGVVTTDGNGEARITSNVGEATPGHEVKVDVIANVDGEQVTRQVSFTPR